MGHSTPTNSSVTLSAFQSLLEEIDRLNHPPDAPPCFEHLLEQTHALSHSLTITLNNLVRAAGGCDAEAFEYIRIAIDNATDSMTTARCLMLELHHLQKKDASG